MQSGNRQHGSAAKPWIDRLDRAAQEVNTFLLVMAIGLAILDGTCLFLFKVRDALPSVARINANPTLAVRPALATTGPATAMLTPVRSGISATGW